MQMIEVQIQEQKRILARFRNFKANLKLQQSVLSLMIH